MPPAQPSRNRAKTRAALLFASLSLLGACSSASTCAGCTRPRPAPAPALRSSPATIPSSRIDMTLLEQELRALRRGGKTQVHYLPASPDEWTIYGDWVAQCARAAAEGSEPPPPPRGFRRLSAPASDAPAGGHSPAAAFVLAEQPELRRGAGAVVLRVGAATDLVIEAPHSFFDRDTLSLALALFAHSTARALLVNTAHRANVARDLDDAARDALARSGQLISDVAHADDAFFTSAHAALARRLPYAPSVQLHGFRDKKAPFDVIVSGSESVFDAAPLAAALRQAFPERAVALYPKDTRQLGGVGNAQAKVSRRYGTPFVHLELSSSLRQELMEAPAARARFVEVLRRALTVPVGGVQQ